MKPRLLIATDFYTPRWDGVTRFLTEVIPRLKDDYDIRLIAPDFKYKSKKKDPSWVKRIGLFPFKVGDFPVPIIGPKLFSIIRKEVREANIVWVQELAPIGLFTALSAISYKKKVVGFEHAIQWDLASKAMKKSNFLRAPVRYFAKILLRSVYNKFSLIMVPSPEVKEILKVNQIRAKKKVVFLGTDIEKFKPANKREAKTAIGINPDTKVIGYCGRIAREKDIQTLIRAFVRLRHHKKDVVLLLVGAGVKDYDRIIANNEDIIAVGKQEDVEKYYQAMDVHVLPSFLETTSLSTLEAMSCGIPVICTEVGLIRDYLKEKHNGMFFRMRNSLALSLKLKYILEHDTKRRAMGENARKTVVKRYSWEGTVQRIKKLFEDLKPAN